MSLLGETKYRARGNYKKTKRDSWVTTVWRATEKEAQDDIKEFASYGNYNKTWIVPKKKASLKHSW